MNTAESNTENSVERKKKQREKCMVENGKEKEFSDKKENVNKMALVNRMTYQQCITFFTHCIAS